jgi:predicted SAM-dependent methyltransferase
MRSIYHLFSSSDNPNSLGAKFRARRLKTFEALFFNHFNVQVNVQEQIRILDVGGTDYFWKNSRIPDLPEVRITLLNINQEKVTHPHINSVVGDATDMKEFPTNSFDLVFSNSVIEHLYTFENQKKMASEIQRVGKEYFIQTPNRYFPVEAHYALPFAQYLPKRFLYLILTQTRLSRLKSWDKTLAKQYLDEIKLLDESEMKQLFPEAKILKEMVWGLTKSLTSHTLF